MPMIAFIGVLISWLIVARKALFAWLASSASCRASWVSRKRRAFWMATPTLAAIVSSSRPSDSP